MTWWWPLRWILSLALLAAGLGALGVMGNGVLAPPPLSVDGGREWLTQREAVVVAFAVVRLVALGVGGYLFAAVAVSGVVRIIDERRGGRLFDRLTLGAARGLIGT